MLFFHHGCWLHPQLSEWTDGLSNGRSHSWQAHAHYEGPKIVWKCLCILSSVCSSLHSLWGNLERKRNKNWRDHLLLNYQVHWTKWKKKHTTKKSHSNFTHQNRYQNLSSMGGIHFCRSPNAICQPCVWSSQTLSFYLLKWDY